MGKTDRLSRRLDQKICVKKDNNNQIFIKDCWLYNLYEVVVEESEVDILEKIKTRDKDKEVVRVVEEMKKVGIKVVRGEEWQLERDLVLKKEKVYIPKDKKLRVEIIQLHYNVLVAKHEGKWKMMKLVTRNYQQPGVTKDVGKYMKECNICQRMENRMKLLAEKLKLSKILEKLWTHLIVDFITKLPIVVRKNAILVVCDRLSKMTHFVVTTEGMSVKGLARLFRDNVWKLHGLPKSIVLDKGPQFVVKMTKKLNRILEIEIKLFMLYYPQTDGQMERMNQELEQYLRFFIDYRQKDWLEWLVLAEFAINNKTHLTTKVFLFMVNYRRKIRMKVDLRKKKMEGVMEFMEKMRKVQEEAGAALKRAQEEMKRQADKERKEAEVQKVGDRMILSMKDLVFKKRLAKKLVDHYVGLYIIDKVVSTNTVKLQLPMSMRIHLVVNVS